MCEHEFDFECIVEGKACTVGLRFYVLNAMGTSS